MQRFTIPWIDSREADGIAMMISSAGRLARISLSSAVAPSTSTPWMWKPIFRSSSSRKPTGR